MFTTKHVADVLASKDNIVILCHRSPDGDTIGAAYALYDALCCIGKTARVECADPFGVRFAHITDGVEFPNFEPKFVVAVDIADTKLLGSKFEQYPVIDMCIDHHGTHVPFAQYTYVESTAASACEIIYEVCCELCGNVNERQAVALYTGMATDTGCFRYSSTTSRTHIIAARLMEFGVPVSEIHQTVFANSKTKVLLEANVISKMQFYCNDLVGVQYVSQKTLEALGATDDDACAVASTLNDIECIKIGITIREMEAGVYRISARSKSPLSAAKLCEKFGGGGHECAAGCTIVGNGFVIYSNLVEEAENLCREAGMI